MTSREFSLNAAACRLLQNIMPGLETAVVFQEKVGYYWLHDKITGIMPLLGNIMQFSLACWLK